MAGEVIFPIQEASPPTVAAPTARNDLAIQGGSARTASQADDPGAGEHACSSSIINVYHRVGSTKTYRRLEGRRYPTLCEAKSCVVERSRESNFPVVHSRATSSGVDRRRWRLRREVPLQS